MPVVDLDLIITRHPAGELAALDLHPPGQPAAQLAPPTPWTLDEEALIAAFADPIAYGQLLTAQLFAPQALLLAWQAAISFAESQGHTLRPRLILPYDAPELHALRWETLYDPQRHAPLAASDRVWLVRLPSTARLNPILIPPRTELRATVVVASPRNLARYRLSEIDVDGEVARAQQALGSTPVTIVGDHHAAFRRQASLPALLAGLRLSPHILYLVCHGKMDAGETLIALEDDQGELDWMPGSRLVAAMENLVPPPLLTILIACRSAGDGYGDALNALGPQLARSGVPAVLGFQGDVSQRTIRRCMPTLWEELRQDGRIDRALAVARREIGQHFWWQPVLWLRAPDGQLWQREEPLSPPLPDPPPLVQALPDDHWLGPDEPRELQKWVALEQRTVKFTLALEQLYVQQNAHAVLDLIERIHEEQTVDADVARLSATIIEMPLIPFAQRLRAAYIAGRIGDLRLPTKISHWTASIENRSYIFGQPNGYWCYLPWGTYRIGVEQNQVETILPAFWIARYPLTVAQYRAFILDDGYRDERWWDQDRWTALQEGKIPRQPWGWDDPRYNQANQPVIAIGWDEASAFCAWLDHQLRSALPGYHIQLPTEAMWEVAAAYAGEPQLRTYPWGEEMPTIDHAIHRTDPRLFTTDAPAPVGCCIAGAAACGALDLAGNVWELMGNSWESYPHTVTLPAPDSYVPWRGGTWSSSALALRATHRDRTRRNWHNYAQGGFRIVITPRP